MGADHTPRLFPGPQPSLSPAEQHLESPVPSAPGALAGGPTQAAPGVRGEEEQWAREIGAQLRRMADDLDALYERRVSAGGGVDGRWDFPPGRGLRAAPPDVPQLLPCAAGSRRGQASGRGGVAAEPPKAPRGGWHGPARAWARGCPERRGAPEPAAAGTEGGAPRSGSYIPGYL